MTKEEKMEMIIMREIARRERKVKFDLDIIPSDEYEGRIFENLSTSISQAYSESAEDEETYKRTRHF